MSKWLRKEKAKKCPVHMAIFDKAATALEEHGYFSKEAVIAEAGLEAVEEAVRWDYLREFLAEEHGLELLPVAERFFKQWTKDASGKRVNTAQERRIFPGKYLATGHGKKTAGYVSVEIDDGIMALHRLANKRDITNGVGKAFRAYIEAVKKRDLLPCDSAKTYLTHEMQMERCLQRLDDSESSQ